MKQPPRPAAIVNRRAHFDYELGDEFVVGIALTGREVRAARDNHVQLKGAYVTVKNDELWLTNASFSVVHNEPKQAAKTTVDTRPRKLLAHRKQINTLLEGKKTGLTIVPLKLFTRGRYIKLVIASARGKKRYDKRQAIKKRDLERETRKNISVISRR